MYKIAITGGIGSGKSTAAKILQEIGFTCFSADKIYNDLLKNEDFVLEVSKRMGIEPIAVDEKITLDKKAVSSLVFGDKSELKKLNECTHPVVMSVLTNKISQVKGEKFVFAEVPVLFEEGYDKLFDYVFVIKRNFDARLSNTMSRDGKNAEEVKRVVKSQIDYEKIPQSDNIIVVNNDGDIEELKAKLSGLMEAIEKK